MRAAAADEPEPAPDKSGFTLLNPTPRVLMREMSTDRPDTTESPYTVDAGHVQVELSFVDYTYDRRNEESETLHAVAAAPMLLKVGLLNNVDLQLGIDPYAHVETTDRATDRTETSDGFGDMTLRLKVNLWGNDEGMTALAVMPFLVFPTGTDGLSSGHAEGGVIVPLGVTFSEDFWLGAMLEMDVVRSAADDRYVWDFVQSVTLGHTLVGDLAGYVEYAGFLNLNGDEDYRGYFDAGLTYAVTPDVQLDCGIRVGLTEAAEDFGVFAGVSWRH